MALDKYEHIFFDLDHTLWDFKSNSRAALRTLYDDYLKARATRLSFNDFYYAYAAVNDQWWQQYRIGRVDKEALRTGRFRETLQRFGLIDEDLTETLASGYVDRSPYQTNLFPGAIELLDWLTVRGHQLHIITNGFEEVQHIKIKESGLSPFFQEIITSEQVEARKPDQRIFNHAFKMAGTQAHQSLMIGDNLDADIGGAAEAGMDQVYFNPEGTKHKWQPTYEVRQLAEIRDVV